MLQLLYLVQYQLQIKMQNEVIHNMLIVQD
nr:MAG TPA: hypothetical protein [Caudoviricetes sp.]